MIVLGVVAAVAVVSACFFIATLITNWWLDVTTGYCWWGNAAWMAAFPIVVGMYLGSVFAGAVVFFLISGVSP